jgi:UDP-glucose 4-epimerase
MKACVLGGSGFLGSHVCDRLSREGHQVRIYDLAESQWRSDAQEMIIGDILDADHLSSTVAGCDAVFNFSGLSDLDDGLDKPLTAANLNIIGNINALSACLEGGVKRYIYASTVYVYSREGGFYRCSKQAAEHFIEQFQQAFDLDFTILRFGSLYGPRSDSRNGLFRIVKKALDDGRLVYSGNSDAMREYIHVEDAAEASVAALGAEFSNQHVVLTGQEPMRVEDLLAMLAEILDLSLNVEFEDQHFVGHYVRTPYAYKPMLGRKYIPPMHVDLGQGLLQLIEYVVSHDLSSK